MYRLDGHMSQESSPKIQLSILNRSQENHIFPDLLMDRQSELQSSFATKNIIKVYLIVPCFLRNHCSKKQINRIIESNKKSFFRTYRLYVIDHSVAMLPKSYLIVIGITTHRQFLIKSMKYNPYYIKASILIRLLKLVWIGLVICRIVLQLAFHGY